MSSILIGTFNAQNQGFSGNIRTLHLRLPVALIPVERSGDKQPDYQVVTGKDQHILGGAWRQQSEAGNEYFSLQLDDPSFGCPLKARLVRQKNSDHWLLFWDRKAD
jgi:uncharacterized protein (DUF736 family)